MNFNNFTIKSQEAIQKAVEITRGAGQQAIEPVHLLKGVIEGRRRFLQELFHIARGVLDISVLRVEVTGLKVVLLLAQMDKSGGLSLCFDVLFRRFQQSGADALTLEVVFYI